MESRLNAYKSNRAMKLLMLNTCDSMGGAAIATYRLHRGLRSIGVDSHLMVLDKRTNDPTVIEPEPRSRLENVIARFFAKRDGQITHHCQANGKGYFSPARCPDKLASKVVSLSPNIVHLFWVNSGFMKIETLKQFKKPIVWTLHDMWPFTGGCHYDDECGRFRDACGKCPVLDSESSKDLSYHVLKRKVDSWSQLPIVVVATSHWLADMARASAVFKSKRIEVIPNGIDTEKYKPIDKALSRHAWGLPLDKNLILFSAFGATSDKRKGNQFLVPALESMSAEGWGKHTELVIIGASEPEHPVDLGMKIHYIGNLNDEISQVLLYSAADVTVAPSMQENLSNTVMESMACGTPVVAFNIGGMPDLIEHMTTGYLASPFEVANLASGIKWVIESKDRHRMLSQAARKSVLEKYTLEKVSSQYIDLYRDILK